MVNKIKAAKRLFEKISLYDLMTSQPMIDAYIKHIKESDIPYESEDDEKEIEQMVEDCFGSHGRLEQEVLID